MPGAILKLQNAISKETLLKLSKLIEGSMYFDEDNLLFFKLEDKIVSIRERDIYLVDILDEPGVKKTLGKIRELFEIAERSSEA